MDLLHCPTSLARASFASLAPATSARARRLLEGSRQGEMKITINNYHAIAMWRWNLKAGLQQQPSTKASEAADDAEEEEEESDGDDDDDVCGICRVAYDGCCPDCKTPGDECPLIWGECTHVFHMHCIIKWLETESSKQQCPMDRRPWVTAGAANSPAPPAGQEIEVA